MTKAFSEVLEVGAAAPSPQELAQILELAEEEGAATFQHLLQYLNKRCGTVMPRPTTDGKVAVVFEHAGTFCVTGAFDHELEALSAAVLAVSQR